MKTANKILLVVNLLLMAAVFTGNYFFLTVGGSDIKALTSGGFVLMGLVNLIFAVAVKGRQVKYVATLAVGLTLACLGDILIGPSFVIGAALFALGHVCFFLAYCVLDRVRPLDLAIGGGIFAAAGSFVLFAPILHFSEGYMQIVCLVYALIISLMVGKAVGNLVRTRSLVTVLVLAGSILFFFSDLMLVFDWFADAGRISGLLCMGTYYPAECLLAISGMAAVSGMATVGKD